MSVSDFSSKDTTAFERTVECDLQNLAETPKDQLSSVYQLEKCIEWIRENKFQRTCLQFPDCLLKDAPSIALHLEEKVGSSFYILADTSYGSCCVDEVAAEHINGDSIIHFGHSCLSVMAKLPVLYIFENYELDVKKLTVEFNQHFSKTEHVIVFYDVVYYHLYSDLCDHFKNSNVVISKLQVPPDEGINNHKAKSLFGRSFEYDSKQKYSAVYVGPDSITLGNLILALPEFQWYQYENNELKECILNRNRFLMRQLHLIEKIKDAKAIGILVGTLGIKNYLEAIERIKYLTKARGKKSYILAVGKPNVAKLANFPEIDIFVSVACTENSLTRDFKEFYKPIVSLFEIEVALGNREWSSEYITDFRQLLPGGVFYKESAENIIPETEVSLVSGKIRNVANNVEINMNSTDVVERDPGTIVEFAGAEYLSNRSWRGLEQNLGETKVEKATIGRSGIPQGYENESLSNTGKR